MADVVFNQRFLKGFSQMAKRKNIRVTQADYATLVMEAKEHQEVFKKLGSHGARQRFELMLKKPVSVKTTEAVLGQLGILTKEKPAVVRKSTREMAVILRDVLDMVVFIRNQFGSFGEHEPIVVDAMERMIGHRHSLSNIIAGRSSDDNGEA